MPISAPDFLINPRHLNTADPEVLRATVSPEAIAAAGPASDLLLIGREGAR